MNNENKKPCAEDVKKPTDCFLCGVLWCCPSPEKEAGEWQKDRGIKT